MAEIGDLPRLVTEFGTMARDYLVQETVGPAKKLGRFSGLSLGAAAAWAIGIVFLSVAGLRAFVDALPAGPYWEALAYVGTAVFLGIVLAVLVAVVPQHVVPTPSEDETARALSAHLEGEGRA